MMPERDEARPRCVELGVTPPGPTWVVVQSRAQLEDALEREPDEHPPRGTSAALDIGGVGILRRVGRADGDERLEQRGSTDGEPWSRELRVRARCSGTEGTRVGFAAATVSEPALA
jgi:hypothetical protein